MAGFTSKDDYNYQEEAYKAKMSKLYPNRVDFSSPFPPYVPKAWEEPDDKDLKKKIAKLTTESKGKFDDLKRKATTTKNNNNKKKRKSIESEMKTIFRDMVQQNKRIKRLLNPGGKNCHCLFDD